MNVNPIIGLNEDREVYIDLWAWRMQRGLCVANQEDVSSVP